MSSSYLWSQMLYVLTITQTVRCGQIRSIVSWTPATCTYTVGSPAGVAPNQHQTYCRDTSICFHHGHRLTCFIIAVRPLHWHFPLTIHLMVEIMMISLSFGLWHLTPSIPAAYLLSKSSPLFVWHKCVFSLKHLELLSCFQYVITPNCSYISQ